MIHSYNLMGKNIVLDVESGSIHEFDQISADILPLFESFSLAEIKENLRNKYKQDDIDETYDDILYLKNEGLLFTPYKKIEYNTQEHVIKAMCLHISHDCDLRCRYCFAKSGSFGGGRKLMEESVVKQALTFLMEASGKRKNLEVDFFGGEPLLNFDVVKSAVSFGRELEKKYGKKINFTLTTNAVGLDDEKAAYINDTMSNVVLSLDGRKEINDLMRPSSDGNGSYELIMPKILKMIKLRGSKDHYVRGTFTRNNLDFSNDLKHMAESGIVNLSLEPVVTDSASSYSIRKEDLPQIFQEYEKIAIYINEKRKNGKEINFFHFMMDFDDGPCVIKRIKGCGAGAEYVAVTPEGDIFPCHQFVGDDKYFLGNIYTGISNYQTVDMFKVADPQNKEECNKCWAKYYCGGGCHANAAKMGNSLDKPYDIGCMMEKKRIECALWLKAQQE